MDPVRRGAKGRPVCRAGHGQDGAPARPVRDAGPTKPSKVIAVDDIGVDGRDYLVVTDKFSSWLEFKGSPEASQARIRPGQFSCGLPGWGRRAG